MSIFEHRKPAAGSQETHDPLQTLRQTLEKLESEEETPRIADLKRILARRIAEMEDKSA